jgi:hypothetical protein
MSFAASENVSQAVKGFRFSLRTLFVWLTAAAIGFALGVLFAERMRPLGAGHSPDEDEFWLDWFYQGNAVDRQTAVSVISTRARRENADQKLIKALCKAASDADRYVRLNVAIGLEQSASSNREARAVLTDLSESDPDTDVRGVAQQALSTGIPNDGEN